MLSAPYPDNLAASPDGTVLVWKVDASGVKNLYTNAGGSIHAITHYTADDGQNIDTPQILPSNDGVVYLWGGVEDEAAGANPNPLQKIPQPQRAIFIVPIAGGDPVQVAEGNGVVLSPKGDAVAFTTAQGQLGVVSLTKSDATFTVGKPEMLPIRGSVIESGMVARRYQDRFYQRARRSLVHRDLHAVKAYVRLRDTGLHAR